MNNKPLKLTFDTPFIDGTIDTLSYSVFKDVVNGARILMGSIIFNEFYVSPKEGTRSIVSFEAKDISFKSVHFHTSEENLVHLANIKPGVLYSFSAQAIESI